MFLNDVYIGSIFLLMTCTLAVSFYYGERLGSHSYHMVFTSDLKNQLPSTSNVRKLRVITKQHSSANSEHGCVCVLGNFAL